MKLYPSLKINFKPSDDELNDTFEFGLNFGKVLLGEKELPAENNNTVTENKENNTSTESKGGLKLWKCVICGEIIESETVPEYCPVCGAGSDAFIEVQREVSTYKIDKEETYVIIGNGAAGFYAANAIKERNESAIIKIISNEPVHSYVRTQLSDLITEKIDDSFYLAKASWYKENNIIEILGVNVDSIDRKNKLVRLDNKQGVRYDKLILANGSYNFVPPTKVKLSDSEVEINSWTYNTVKGIHTIKKIADVNILKEELPEAKNVVIIGGGLLGLEAAWEIQKRNINVTVIELADRMLPRQLDKDGSKLFESLVNKTPVKVLLGASVDFINADETGVKSLQLKSGEVIAADSVIFSVGVRSNIFLAQPSGILCNRGIIVNDYMETNISDIYACGDVAECDGIYYGNWPAAIEMGKVAGANATGDKIKFEKFVSSTIFQAMNTQVFSAGTINFDDPILEKVGYVDEINNKYSKLFFQNNKLVGGILMGDVSTSVKIMEGIQKGEDKATVLSKGAI